MMMSAQPKWSRRTFLQVSGSAASLALLAACQPITVPAGETVPEAVATAPAEEAASAGTGAARFAYVGTYTRGAPGGWSEAAEATHPVGVSAFSVDADGVLTLIETVPSDNPSFVALHPSGNFLYVSNEIADYEGNDAGSMEAYAIDNETGQLTLLNTQAVGSIPAHLQVDPTGSFVVVGNYVGASFQILPINADGSLEPVSSEIVITGSGPNAERQEAPHPHAVLFDPTGKFIATADLGTDMVRVYTVDGGQLALVSEAAVEPGSGPRHVAFHPGGNFLYVINELTANIAAFAFDPATGQLGNIVQLISTVPEDFPEHKSTAEIMVHPSGKFLYGSNRKFEDHPEADAIVAYSIFEETGELTLIGYTTENIQFPRAFNFDPTGTWLYACNQKGDTIVQHAINQETGELTATGVVTETPVPVSLVFKL